MLRSELARAVRRAVEGLSTRDRALFLRKYRYYQSTARIAAELGLTERAVEGLEIIPAQTVGEFCAVPPVGRMLWEEDGAAYAQPLEFRYGTTQYDGFEALVFGMSDHGAYYTDFSLPARGEHIRGYALWVVRPDAAQETWFNYTCDYVRRKDLFSYLCQLPSEYARTVGLNHGGYNIFFGLGLSHCDVYDGGQEGRLIAP